MIWSIAPDHNAAMARLPRNVDRDCPMIWVTIRAANRMMKAHKRAWALTENPSIDIILATRLCFAGGPPETNSNSGIRLLMANSSIAAEQSDTAMLRNSNGFARNANLVRFAT